MKGLPVHQTSLSVRPRGALSDWEVNTPDCDIIHQPVTFANQSRLDFVCFCLDSS